MNSGRVPISRNINWRLALIAPGLSLAVKGFGEAAVREKTLFQCLKLTAEKVCCLIQETDKCIGRFFG